MERVAQSLLLLQAAFGLTATLGLVALMGFNPVYAVAPGLSALALVVLGAFVARGRRWSLCAVLVVEVLALAGFQLQQLLGLLPQLDATVNLTGLLTTVALPLVILLLSARLLATGPERSGGRVTGPERGGEAGHRLAQGAYGAGERSESGL